MRTGSDIELVLDEVRLRLNDKDAEITYLRQKLSDAQGEAARRAASTDEALKTIDRVVRSFELQAEVNRTIALQAAEQPKTPSHPEHTEPIRFSPEGVDNNERHQDIRRV